MKTLVQITLVTFDKESYAYGETMTLSIEAKIAGGAPLAGKTVYIWAGNAGTQVGNAGTQVGSVVLDDQGKATFPLKVNSFLRDIFPDPDKQTLRAYYQGSDQYDRYVSMMTLAGTNKQNFTFTNADIALTQEITAPALNQNPVRKLEVGETFFTAEVLWSPDHTAFQADTPYSASILLKPKQSYDFKSIGTITYQGTQVTLSYPAGTNGKTHDFVVAHMLTRAMNGKNPGEIEFPTVEETEAGLTFRLYGLSPISVGWKQVAEAGDDDNL